MPNGSVTARNAGYNHTLQWPSPVGSPSSFKPAGPCYANNGPLISNTSHTIAVASNGSVTHSHSLSAYGSFSRTVPPVNGPGSYTTTLGQTITIQSQTQAVAAWAAEGVSWKMQLTLTGLYTATTVITSSQGYNLTQNYSANPSQFSQFARPDRVGPDGSWVWGATAVVCDAGAFLIGIAGAPEIGAVFAVVGLGYGIYGVLDDWFNL